MVGRSGTVVVVAARVVSAAVFLLEPHAAPNNVKSTSASARSFFAWTIKELLCVDHLIAFQVMASPMAAWESSYATLNGGANHASNPAPHSGSRGIGKETLFGNCSGTLKDRVLERQPSMEATIGVMWHSIFHVDVPVAEKIVRPILVYVFLIVALRLAGKRELAQLNSVDFVVLLAVANAVQNGIIGNDNSVTGGLVGATTLFAINALVAYLLFRNARVRRLVQGHPTSLIKDGVIDEHALRHERLSLEDQTVACEKEGATDLAEVDHAILEPNGNIVMSLKTPDYDSQRHDAIMTELARLRTLIETSTKG